MIEPQSVITCPLCGYERAVTMPTDACQFSYVCDRCEILIKPKPGDCCVFCSYGSIPCPSVQQAHSDILTMKQQEVLAASYQPRIKLEKLRAATTELLHLLQATPLHFPVGTGEYRENASEEFLAEIIHRYYLLTLKLQQAINKGYEIELNVQELTAAIAEMQRQPRETPSPPKDDQCAKRTSQ